MSLIGFLSGLAALITITNVGDTFGLPGSPAYRTYESFNRVMALLLFLEVGPILTFYCRTGVFLSRVGRMLTMIVLVAWLGMVVGTAAEFWLYSELPYGIDNMRSTAYSIFSISGLLVGLSFLILGFNILAYRQLPRYLGVMLILYFPVDIALFIGGQSIFLATTLLCIVIAAFTLKHNHESTITSHKSV